MKASATGATDGEDRIGNDANFSIQARRVAVGVLINTAGPASWDARATAGDAHGRTPMIGPAKINRPDHSHRQSAVPGMQGGEVYGAEANAPTSGARTQLPT